MPSRTTTLLATLLLAWVIHGLCPPHERGPAEPWIVLFESRSFDLTEFRSAVRRDVPAKELATITDDLAERVRADQADFAGALREFGGQVRQQWWLINGCAVDIPAGTSQGLATLPGVASIEPDSGFRPGANRTSETYDHRVHEVHRLGYTGEGVGLAIMDTGQDANCNGTNRPHRLYYPQGDHDNNTGRGIAGSRLECNLQLGAMPAEDLTGHGTAVAALAAGAAWGPPGAMPGHAPGASIAGYAIAEQPDGTSAVSTVISAWQAISADRQTYRLVGANNSYGGSPNPLSAAQRALDSAAYNADLLITVCAYNTGPAGTAHSQSACNGISVGAVVGDSHKVTSYSARGPLHSDVRRTYPDLCAVSSTIGPNADCEASAGPWFGTSFAAPRVLGAAALLRQAEPALSALETKAILLASTADLQPQNQDLGRNGPGVGLLRDDLALATALDPTRWTTITLEQAGALRLPIAVHAGEPTSVAISWHRSRFDHGSWTNVDLCILDGDKVIATGDSARNLYEHVRFVPDRTGSYIAELRATALHNGPQQVALAISQIEASSPGSYHGLGQPCAGTAMRPGRILVDHNGDASAADLIADSYQLSATDWVFEFTAPAQGLHITGFEALTGLAGTPATLTTSLHLEQDDKPASSAVATGTMQIGAQAGWNATDFGTPVTIPGGARYYVGFGVPAAARFQIVLTSGESIRAFQRSPCSGLFQRDGTAPAGLRILGDRPTRGLQPQLNGHGLPKLDRPFTTALRQTQAHSMAILATTLHIPTLPGIASLATDAPACARLEQMDHLVLTVTDTAGCGQATIAIPDNAALCHIAFRQQWFVLDPTKDAAQMSSSQAATGQIGDR